jgi:N-formylmaleamate deformylase
MSPHVRDILPEKIEVHTMTDWPSGVVDDLIHYHRTGGAKPALVLAHGYTDFGLNWTRTAAHLAADYDIVMPDARGHGQTPLPAEPFTAELQAADLARVITGLGLPPPVVMGHSMGAVDTALLAANYPDLVRAAILVDPPWWLERERGDADSHGAWKQDLSELKMRDWTQMVAHCREQNPRWDQQECELWATAKQQFDLRNFDLLDLWPRRWQDYVSEIRCPILLMTADDGIVTSEVATAAQKLNPQVQIAHIRDAGHSIQREQFDQFLQAVRDFLKRV